MTEESIGILVTSWPGHKKYLKAMFECLEDSPYPVVMGWDDMEPFNQRKYGVTVPECFAAFFNLEGLAKEKMRHRGKGRLHEGERRQTLKGAERIKALGCGYMFKMCGDQTVSNVSRIKELIGLMGDADIIYVEPEGKRKKDRIDMESFMAKVDPIIKVFRAVDMKLCRKLLEIGVYKKVNEFGMKAVSETDFWKNELKWTNVTKNRRFLK